MTSVPRLELIGLAAQGLPVLDLRLAAGERLVISGPSGIGKTRLLRAIADLDPHAGELRLDGRPCAELAPCEWRRRVGYLPAESGWWSDRVAEHFPDDGASGDLEGLGLSTAMLERRVDGLSTGERQRLALARLLANAPAVLMLDEPTANLDPDNSARVEALIGDRCTGQGVAVIWISHDREQIARVAHRHLVLDAEGLHPPRGDRP